jgi:predicted Zn finger-like uncharacterized protein
MKLRTVCPECGSVFRLAAEQVEAGRGWVQCGVCGIAFDVRATLTLEDGSPLPEPAPPEPEVEATPQAVAEAAAEAPAEIPPSEPGAQVAERPAAAEPAQMASAEAPPAEAEAAAEAADEGEAPRPVVVPAGVARRESGEELPSIILIDPDAAAPTDLGPLPQIPPAAAPAAATPARPAAQIEYATATAPRTAPSGRRKGAKHAPAWVWTSLAALLTLTLLGQAAWLLRDPLLSRAPQLRPLYEMLCAPFGCTLGLPQNLAQLQIVGSDLQKEAGGRLTLTLTLGNRAQHAQAWPMLVLTLTDARGRPLSRRSFAPSEYLDDPARAAAGVPPLSEQPLTLPIAVAGIAPMGFDLKLAY